MGFAIAARRHVMRECARHRAARLPGQCWDHRARDAPGHARRDRTTPHQVRLPGRCEPTAASRRATPEQPMNGRDAMSTSTTRQARTLRRRIVDWWRTPHPVSSAVPATLNYPLVRHSRAVAQLGPAALILSRDRVGTQPWWSRRGRADCRRGRRRTPVQGLRRPRRSARGTRHHALPEWRLPGRSAFRRRARQ